MFRRPAIIFRRYFHMSSETIKKNMLAETKHPKGSTTLLFLASLLRASSRSPNPRVTGTHSCSRCTACAVTRTRFSATAVVDCQPRGFVLDLQHRRISFLSSKIPQEIYGLFACGSQSLFATNAMRNSPAPLTYLLSKPKRQLVIFINRISIQPPAKQIPAIIAFYPAGKRGLSLPFGYVRVRGNVAEL
jgi:hypothetical protein